MSLRRSVTEANAGIGPSFTVGYDVSQWRHGLMT